MSINISRCLDGDLESPPGFCSKMVMATAVLHNIAVSENRESVSEMEENHHSCKQNLEERSQRKIINLEIGKLLVSALLKVFFY